MRLQALLPITILAASLSCNNAAPKNQGSSAQQAIQESSYKLSSPFSGQTLNTGDTLIVSYTIAEQGETPDSMLVSVGGRQVGSTTAQQYRWNTQQARVGSQAVLAGIWKDGKEVTKLYTTVKILPPPPKQYTYEVVKSYPHDDNAYTQGLFIHNNLLYESTGQRGQSTLRKVDLPTGRVLKSVALDNQYFGEGITELNGKIYQLTWQSQKGFVYNLETFEKIGEFTYSTEGWGITTDGTYLLMTDGSSHVRFIDPQTFKEVKSIEVYTDQGVVNLLNELEYINGELWANVYTQDVIVAINPATGAVTKVVDMRNLLPASLHTDNTEVLNGIAYNGQTKQLYVTGKNWPRLYEVRLKEKK